MATQTGTTTMSVTGSSTTSTSKSTVGKLATSTFGGAVSGGKPTSKHQSAMTGKAAPADSISQYSKQGSGQGGGKAGKQVEKAISGKTDEAEKSRGKDGKPERDDDEEDRPAGNMKLDGEGTGDHDE